jgi:hypothetical protein
MSSAGSAGAVRQHMACSMCGAHVEPAAAVQDARGAVFCRRCYRGLTDGDADGAGPAPQPAPASHPGNGRVSSHSAHPASASPPKSAHAASTLRSKITCPHCWHRFATEDILWVAQHAELRGDPVLGPDQMCRFLPTRFSVDAHAIDSRGMVCQVLACPRCHLNIPRAFLTMEPLFVSIIGVPSSGKSYFLTSMAWELRRQLPSHFQISFTDADTLANRKLNEYEQQLFLHGDSDAIVALPKTEEQGELYDQIRFGEQITTLPKPFLFSLRPSSHHPNAAHAAQASRIICMYDNAGESFDAGKDSASSPVTQHMAKSRVLMFLFDPTQDPRFRDRCLQFSDDPQLKSRLRATRQETILTEAAMRIRRYTGLGPTKKHDRPLIVLVPKWDVWAPLLDVPIDHEPLTHYSMNGHNLMAVETQRIETTSRKLRELLCKLTPEFVSAAEDFCQQVLYVPVSALGAAPEEMPMADGAGTSGLGIRPRNIKPRWVTVPVLYMFAKWATGLIAAAR